LGSPKRQNFIGCLNNNSDREIYTRLCLSEEQKSVFGDEVLSAGSAPASLEKPEGEPAEVFDFYLGALEEILGSMLDKNDPAKGGHHEKD
jgi:hypothetical protein